MGVVQVQVGCGEGCGPQQLTAPQRVFEAISELEVDTVGNRATEEGLGQFRHAAGADIEPGRELELDQNLVLQNRAA